MTHRSLVVGAGFAGLRAAQRLQRAGMEVTVLAPEDHVFSPLLYQVATGVLDSTTVALPVGRALTAPRSRWVRASATHIDLAASRVRCSNGEELSFDTLLIATGMSTLPMPMAQCPTPIPCVGLKSLADAQLLRSHLFANLCQAAKELPNSAARTRWSTVVVVGGGPTGVELAGSLAELTGPCRPQVVLVERSRSLCSQYSPRLQRVVHRDLLARGVDVRLHTQAGGLFEGELALDTGRLAAQLVAWVPGVRPAVPPSDGFTCSSDGGLVVNAALQVPGWSHVYVVGDVARPPQAVPRVAPAAQQMADRAADNLCRTLRGQAPRPFAYRDLGSMAAIGTHSALLQNRWLGVSGPLVYLLWLAVHAATLTTPQRRHLLAQWLQHHRAGPTRL